MRIIGIIVASLLILAVFGAGSVHAQSGVVTATVRPNPLEVTVSAPSTVTVGQWFDISADIANLGDQTITGTTATIHSPQEVAIKGGQKKKVGDLSGGLTKTVTWRAKATSTGSFVIQVEATGSLAGEQISSSDTTIISSVVSLGHRLLQLIFGA